MADLINQTIVVTNTTAGTLTDVQVLGGNGGNQFLVADFQLTAAQSATLAGSIPNNAVKFFKGTQTVSLAAANNTAYTISATAGLVAGMIIAINTQAGAGAPTYVSINTVDSGTATHVTFVSGANAANVTNGDIIIVASLQAGSVNNITQVAGTSALYGVNNAV